MKVIGNKNTPLLEIYNRMTNLWSVRWDKKEQDDGSYSFYGEIIDHKPTLEEIKELVYNQINEEVKENIYSGFKYKGNTVYLSLENQLNYKAAFDLETVPITFKFGDEFVTFTSKDELFDFYIDVQTHIQKCLADGYAKKQNLNLEEYASILSET